MDVVLFLIFMVLSWAGFFLICLYSSCRQYFIKALPVLLFYSVLTAYLLHAFHYERFWLYYLITSTIFFVYKVYRMSGGFEDTYDPLVERKNQKRSVRTLASMRVYTIVSMVLYLMGFVLSVHLFYKIM
jgi:hypothetical protein